MPADCPSSWTTKELGDCVSLTTISTIFPSGVRNATLGSTCVPSITAIRLRPGRSSSSVSPTVWSPRFVDYLFLAFNTSTAFSPTDTPVLSRWAKVLSMLQSLVSLSIVAILASRAVGLL